MEDACEKAFLLADQALAAEANSPRPSVETLEQEVFLFLLFFLFDHRFKGIHSFTDVVTRLIAPVCRSCS